MNAALAKQCPSAECGSDILGSEHRVGLETVNRVNERVGVNDCNVLEYNSFERRYVDFSDAYSSVDAFFDCRKGFTGDMCLNLRGLHGNGYSGEHRCQYHYGNVEYFQYFPCSHPSEAYFTA